MTRSRAWLMLIMTGCLLVGLGVSEGSEASSTPPDLILFNGTVLTMDASRSTGQSVAILGGRIAGVGSNDQIRALAGKQTRMIDLQGKTVLPGFIDSRVLGPFGYWEALRGVRLIDSSGAPMSGTEEIAVAVKAFVASGKVAQGQWVVAAGFDPRLDGSRRFGREWADDLAPRNPLLMLSLDHHVALLNSPAIDRLDLKTLTFPEGSGQVERNSKGEATGILRELPVFLAMNRVWSQVPYETRRQATASFVDAASRFGITTVGTLLAVPADLEVAEDLLKNDELPIRMVVEALGPNVEARKALETYAREGKSPNVDRLRIGPPTYPLDGSMLSGRAALFQAYADAPWTSGALSMAPGTFQDLVKGWASGKEGVVLDASGSLAVHMVIDASERSREADPSPVPGQARPLLRVDGVDLVEGDDRSRLALLAKSGWVVSLQPTRLPYRAYMAHAIGEERMKEALPYRSLVDAGVTVAINSNWPMSAQTFQPTQILKWAVSGGEGRSQEALSMEQALKAYTAGAAGALGLSDRLGSIEVGKQADLVVLDRNPLEMASSPELLPGVPVRMTIASGTVVFEERKTAAGPAPEKAAVAMAGKRPASSSVPPPPASRD